MMEATPRASTGEQAMTQGALQLSPLLAGICQTECPLPGDLLHPYPVSPPGKQAAVRRKVHSWTIYPSSRRLDLSLHQRR